MQVRFGSDSSEELIMGIPHQNVVQLTLIHMASVYLNCCNFFLNFSKNFFTEIMQKFCVQDSNLFYLLGKLSFSKYKFRYMRFFALLKNSVD